MNLSLENLIVHLPHLNKKIYGEADFFKLCRKERIKVAELSLKDNIRGYYSNYRGRTFIIINKNLSRMKWLEVAFHELGHHFLHAPVPSSVFFDSQNLSSKQEMEAQSFALLALIPITLLKQIEESPLLMEDYPIYLIEQRMKLFELFGI
jgi:Zn-dependent peptidase ImmA (M78 family)